MLLAEIRAEIARLGVVLEGEGLLSGTAGNISVRTGELVAITPSGMPYGSVAAADVTVVGLGGDVVDGARRPSSELYLHLGPRPLPNTPASPQLNPAPAQLHP